MVATRLAERRKHLRAYIPIAATLRCHRTLTVEDGLLQNLSEGGALIACRCMFETNDRVQVTLHMPGGSDIIMQAVTTRAGLYNDNTAFVALSFQPPMQQAAQVIDEYIRSETANRHSRAVLVIDESASRLRQVSEHLVTRGYRPLLATTALQVTSLLEAELESVVLLLVGSSLRSGSVATLVEWLGESYPKLHLARLGDTLNGTRLQNTLDRVAREKPPTVPWVI